MNMKKFVKKPLAIAVLMLTFGGVANMARAADILQSQDVSATKEVKQGGAFKVEFIPSSKEVVSGKQVEDSEVFILKVSDTALHSGWALITTGSSKGGFMYTDSGDKVKLDSSEWTWSDSDDSWHINDDGNAEQEMQLLIPKDAVVRAGKYHFTGRVNEFID
ncbi:MyfA/PsaA family fimbrial adhesin [Yersinia enterocolitica]|uniref:MyfA/PsaA family fimbrial adhesin n=1 Tax=Yersinia enterocolitica TaxID=630 RepID=UPI0028625E6A|nr:MyfA/PsaA family fimbrial adhesin [Yersinia enterocolitica]EKN3965767.1 MyfA/PsaA family fimbrial adhesin [Yersinia enterocolitica]EKN4017143.1 MyfA/PsaA family fimbrial adhesin [Yersinia enterocolitica]EKN4192994.1 MyfA/PsaA family fimbrial adhesin [Yersinia enterocolitica]EKN4896194.1 MyfA/PsaA family fimbrial adhesin [Yersinia enterocolitica]